MSPLNISRSAVLLAVLLGGGADAFNGAGPGRNGMATVHYRREAAANAARPVPAAGTGTAAAPLHMSDKSDDEQKKELLESADDVIKEAAEALLQAEDEADGTTEGLRIEGFSAPVEEPKKVPGPPKKAPTEDEKRRSTTFTLGQGGGGGGGGGGNDNKKQAETKTPKLELPKVSLPNPFGGGGGDDKPKKSAAPAKPAKSTLEQIQADAIASAIGGVVLGGGAGIAVDILRDDLNLAGVDPAIPPVVGATLLGAAAYAAGSSEEGLLGKIVRGTFGGLTKFVGRSIKQKAIDTVEETEREIKAIPTKVTTAVQNKVDETVEDIKATPGRVKEGIETKVTETVEEIKATPGRVVESTKQAVADTEKAIEESIKRTVDVTVEKVEKTVEDVVSVPKKIVEDVTGKVSEVLPERPPSPPKAPVTKAPPTPEAKRPTLSLPKVSLPKVEPPKVSLPKVERPKVSLPKVEPPKPKAKKVAPPPPAAKKAEPPKPKKKPADDNFVFGEVFLKESFVPEVKGQAAQKEPEAKKKPSAPKLPSISLPKVELPKKAPAPPKQQKKDDGAAKAAAAEKTAAVKAKAQAEAAKKSEQQRIAQEKKAEQQRIAEEKKAAAAEAAQKRKDEAESRKTLALEAAESECVVFHMDICVNFASASYAFTHFVTLLS